MAGKQEKQREVSAGTCVYRPTDDGYEFLLVQSHKSAPVWGFPKGHVDPGEKLEDAAHRETYEETGVMVQLLDGLPMCRTTGKDVHLFLARQVGRNEPQPYDPDDEIAQVGWYPASEAKTMIHKYQRKALTAALKKLAENDDE